jgi:hypothetical protein
VWGSFKYNASKDVARVDVPVEQLKDSVESLVMNFEKDNNAIRLVVAWENVKVALPISL